MSSAMKWLRVLNSSQSDGNNTNRLNARVSLLLIVRSMVLRLTVPEPKPEDDALAARKSEIHSLRQAVSLLKTKLLELERRLELLEAGGGDPRLSSRQ